MKPCCKNCAKLTPLDEAELAKRPLAGGVPWPIGRCTRKKISPGNPLVGESTWCIDHTPIPAAKETT